MTNQEKIAQGFYTSHTDSITGEVTQIVYTDAQVQESLNWVNPTPQPTKEELLAKLEELQTQIAQLGK
jgi:hypothetical protein